VDAGVKAGLLELIWFAVGRGWSARRASGALGIDGFLEW
jgi:hypothetical protein